MTSNGDDRSVDERVASLLGLVDEIDRLDAEIAPLEAVDFRALKREAARLVSLAERENPKAKGGSPTGPLGRYAAATEAKERSRREAAEKLKKAESDLLSRHRRAYKAVYEKRTAARQRLSQDLGLLADRALGVDQRTRSESLEVLCLASERSRRLRLTLTRSISATNPARPLGRKETTKFGRAFAMHPRFARACLAELLLQLDGTGKFPWMGGLFPDFAPRPRDEDRPPDVDTQLAAIEALSGLVGESRRLDDRIAAKLKCDLDVFPYSSYVRTFARLAKENDAVAGLLTAKAKGWDWGMRRAAKKALDVALGRA